MQNILKKEYSVLKKESNFIKTLKGEKKLLPFWFMRQAGRYLPEYRKLRTNAGGFMDLCFNPELATEVTLQPLDRYGMDAAILFSDILVIPHALGQKVSFKESIGPILEDLELQELNFNYFHETLDPIYQTIEKIKQKLNDDKALIGFAGSPWTVATYMVEKGTSKEFINIRKMMYQEPENLQKIIDLLTEATSRYLIKQIESGVDALQLFDSWASILPEKMFRKWIIEPNAKIVARVKEVYPDIPIIGFPKGAGLLYPDFIKETKIDAVSLDHTIPHKWASENIQTLCPVQGCLDPALLLAGGDIMISETKKILDSFASNAFVFNLGHGINKDTPPENLNQLVSFLKEYRAENK